jgi:hypothetical protein
VPDERSVVQFGPHNAKRGGGLVSDGQTATIHMFGDTDLAALYAYWASKCGNRAMPSRADINPAEITSLLPNIFILEIRHPLRFRFRLVGAMICQRWNQNNTGMWLDELNFDVEPGRC